MNSPESFGWLSSSFGGARSKSIDLMSAIIAAKSETELLAAVSNAAGYSGFERILIGTQWVASKGERCFQVLSGYPLEWQTTYARRDYMARDPTVKHCQARTSSLVWNEDQFQQADAMELLEEARGYGLGHGMSIPIHEATGVKSMVSFVRDQPICKNPLEANELVKAGEVIAHLAHFSFRRMNTPHVHRVLPKRLTSSEVSALRWVAAGKTSWEASRIMNIAEATVVFHLNNAMKKLDVVNRPQAIAAAFRLGLLE